MRKKTVIIDSLANNTINRVWILIWVMLSILLYLTLSKWFWSTFKNLQMHSDNKNNSVWKWGRSSLPSELNMLV